MKFMCYRKIWKFTITSEQKWCFQFAFFWGGATSHDLFQFRTVERKSKSNQFFFSEGWFFGSLYKAQLYSSTCIKYVNVCVTCNTYSILIVYVRTIHQSSFSLATKIVRRACIDTKKKKTIAHCLFFLSIQTFVIIVFSSQPVTKYILKFWDKCKILLCVMLYQWLNRMDEISIETWLRNYTHESMCDQECDIR